MSEPADARGLARRAFLVTGAGLVPTPAEFAQSRYPSKPEQLIVPLPAGTSPDLFGVQLLEAVDASVLRVHAHVTSLARDAAQTSGLPSDPPSAVTGRRGRGCRRR